MSDPIRAEREQELVEAVAIAALEGDIEAAKTFRSQLAEIQNSPSPHDGYRVVYGSTVRQTDTHAICPDCGRELHSTGVSFCTEEENGYTDEEGLISLHQNVSCKRLKYRLWRLHWRLIGRPKERWKHRKYRSGPKKGQRRW